MTNKTFDRGARVTIENDTQTFDGIVIDWVHRPTGRIYLVAPPEGEYCELEIPEEWIQGPTASAPDDQEKRELYEKLRLRGELFTRLKNAYDNLERRNELLESECLRLMGVIAALTDGESLIPNE